MIAEGIDVVGMGAGQPDFPSPQAAVDAARASIEGGMVRYGPAGGIPELKQAVAHHVEEITGTTRNIDPSEIVVTNGAKEGLALTFMALCDPGDEILVPLPSWVSYEPMVTMASASMVTIPTKESEGFKLTPDALEEAIGSRAKILLLNSPSNPTGSVYSAEELVAISAVAAAHDLWIVSDELYWPFIFEGTFASLGAVPGIQDRSILVHGCSKAYAMMGWRVGFLTAPPTVAKAITNLKSHFSSNTAIPSQHAALAALQGGTESIDAMQEAFIRRRSVALDALDKIKGISVVPPAGSFYIFPRVSDLYGGEVHNSIDFCAALLEDGRVAAVLGAAFGEDRCIRLSIAVSDERLAEGLERLAGFVATHCGTNEEIRTT